MILYFPHQLRGSAAALQLQWHLNFEINIELTFQPFPSLRFDAVPYPMYLRDWLWKIGYSKLATALCWQHESHLNWEVDFICFRYTVTYGSLWLQIQVQLQVRLEPCPHIINVLCSPPSLRHQENTKRNASGPTYGHCDDGQLVKVFLKTTQPEDHKICNVWTITRIP